jgi:peptidoglycan hydrolase-like protein with peptidoglycan-binding domain
MTSRQLLSYFYLGILFCVTSLCVVQAQTTIISNPYTSTITTTQASNNSDTSNANCLDFRYDLYQGLSDRFDDQSVTKLQIFLNKNQYLKAEPNGYFGPATNSAVKVFQSKNGISNTGRVGPATRLLIKNTSCKTNTNTASVINSVNANNVDRINSTNTTVTSPSKGMIIRTENKIPIEWNSVPNAIYDIKLEDKNGLGFGLIAGSAGGNSYSWDVGKVYSAKTNSEIYVEPGTYRIALTSSNYRSDVPDQFSGLFTILGKPLVIDTIMPSLVYNNVDNSVVLYGRGFEDTTSVVYSNDDIKRIIKPSFISSDGKIVVFKIPSQAIISQYSVSVYNTYDSGATSTPSNAVSLTIK